ncbi:MAG: MBL fold metallo-hydrolase RNA specificity domain-containing protein [Candidatus Bilamarchaeaceae archaeon]
MRDEEEIRSGAEDARRRSDSKMKITFYGGATEVGRSCMLLEDGNRNLMLDAGIKLGETVEYPDIPEEKLRQVRNIAISHAHLDHCGYLPHIYSKGCRPKIYATKPTHDLAGVLLSDYRRIQKKPEFKQKDVDGVMKDMQICEYNEPVHSDFNFTLHNAGHILGASMVKIGNKILYSGDISTRKGRVLEPCERWLHAETLIVENTYGGKEDIIPPIKESAQKLVKSINETIREGGHVLIPSFGIGRSQEILLLLDDYMRSGVLDKNTRIYMDGMITKTMRIYRHNAYYANDEIKKTLLMSEYDPFKSPNFRHPKNKDKSDVLEHPSVIVSTSGMLTGGPALTYLGKLCKNPRNKIIFVGYQAEGTPGSKILAGEKKVTIRDYEFEMNMKVEEVKISGHADFNDLYQFIKSVRGLKKIFLVHGEKSELKGMLDKDYEVVVPEMGKEYRV